MLENAENENESSSFNEENKNQEISSNNDDKSEIKEKTKTKITEGSNILHILPFKLHHEKNIIRKDVEKNFENNIINKENDLYINSFRGRVLNGKKFDIKKDQQNFNINYLDINKIGKESEYSVNSSKPIEQYYFWKYDEEIKYLENKATFYQDKNITNFNQIFKELDILS